MTKTTSSLGRQNRTEQQKRKRISQVCFLCNQSYFKRSSNLPLYAPYHSVHLTFNGPNLLTSNVSIFYSIKRVAATIKFPSTGTTQRTLRVRNKNWSGSGDSRRISPIMKGSGALVATVVAASTVALTSSSSSGRDADMTQGFCSSGKKVRAGEFTSSDKEKFAPRFDGLRFIETLVTAHR